MQPLFATGRIIDAILALVVLEAAVLIIVRNKFSPAPSRTAVVTALAAGAALMLAVRAALRGGAWPPVAGWLLASLIAHGLDLYCRGWLRAAAPATDRRADD